MIRLALVHIRRYLKNPILLLMMGPIPLFLVLGSLFFSDSDQITPNVAYVLESNGIYEIELLENLGVEEKFIYHDRESALEGLMANELAGVIIIPKTFSTDIEGGVKPQVEILKTTEGAGTAEVEIQIEQQINTWLTDYYNLNPISLITTKIEFKEKPVDMSMTIFIVMIIYFMFIGATSLAKDVYQLKQQKVLHRALSTANKDIEIFGGLILAMCFIQGICFTIVYYIGMMVLDVSMPNPLLPLLLMFSMSFVASSLVIFVTRVVKNPSLIEMSIVMYALVGFILSMLSINLFDFGFEPTLMMNIAKLFPIYWAFDTALNLTLWPNLIIILLFGVAFLSAGSFKLKNFIQN